MYTRLCEAWICLLCGFDSLCVHYPNTSVAILSSDFTCNRANWTWTRLDAIPPRHSHHKATHLHLCKIRKQKEGDLKCLTPQPPTLHHPNRIQQLPLAPLVILPITTHTHTNSSVRIKHVPHLRHSPVQQPRTARRLFLAHQVFCICNAFHSRTR